MRGVVTRAVRLRMNALAELVAEGHSLRGAAKTLGVTRGEATNAWRNIVNEMGMQAI